jgi:hypothetical protein
VEVPASLLIWGLSCKTTFNKELWTSSFPLYSMKPNLRNLFMKKLTRAGSWPRVKFALVPISPRQICVLPQAHTLEALLHRSVASPWCQHQEICSAGEFYPAALAMDPSQPATV